MGYNSKDFDRRRFVWLDQVLADPALPSAAFAVAYVVSQGFREDYDGDAWMGLRYIAERTRLALSTVKLSIKLLKARGHWRIEGGRPGGRGHSNHYVMIEKGAENRPTKGPQISPFEPNVKAPISDLKGPKIGPATTKRTGGVPAAPNFLPEQDPEPDPTPRRDTVSAEGAAADPPARDKASVEGCAVDAAGDTFAAFWAAYPKHVGKEGAERKFRRALRQHKIPTAQIVAAAKRYAIEQHGNEPRFIANPSNWLKDARWADEGSGAATIDQYGNPVAPRPSKKNGSFNVDDVVERLKAQLGLNGGGRQ
jgi:hypothetical protein